MRPPFYRLREPCTWALGLDRWAQKYNNIEHGRTNRAWWTEVFSCGGQIPSLGHRADFLTRLTFALFSQCVDEGSGVSCDVEWHVDVRRGGTWMVLSCPLHLSLKQEQ